MLHGVFEEHEVHHGVGIVVLSKGFSQSAGEGVDVGELVVELVIEGADEVGENERLGVNGLEELGEVEFGEVLLADVGDEASVLSEVFGVDESVSEDTLALVHPKSDDLIGLLDSFLLGNEKTLEDVSQMTNIELVMEVDSGLTESTGDFTVKTDGTLDHGGEQLVDCTLELLEMLVQEARVDLVERGGLGERNSDGGEMTLESGVDKEGTGGGVHGTDVEGVLDFLEHQLGAIVPMAVVLVLTDESDGRLRVVSIELGHVKIIDEVDELELANGGVGARHLLLELLLKDSLEQSGVGVVVEVDNLLEVLITVGNELVEETLGDLGLTATGTSDEKRRVTNLDELLHEVLRGDGVNSGDSVVGDTLGSVDDGVHVLGVELGPLL